MNLDDYLRTERFRTDLRRDYPEVTEREAERFRNSARPLWVDVICSDGVLDIGTPSVGALVMGDFEDNHPNALFLVAMEMSKVDMTGPAHPWERWFTGLTHSYQFQQGRRRPVHVQWSGIAKRIVYDVILHADRTDLNCALPHMRVLIQPGEGGGILQLPSDVSEE